MVEKTLKDYSLVGAQSQQAIEQGLAEADWYRTPVPKQLMRELHQRKNWPAIRDCLFYFGLIGLFGYLTYLAWGHWYVLFPMLAYGVLYASASDARWHESSHGTAFRSDWLNNTLYEIASFMVLRESVPWRWSHTRHHSDTIIVGRDPEIAVPRPPSLLNMALKCMNFQALRRYVTHIALHSTGRLTEVEQSFIPEEEAPKVYLRARIYACIYLVILGLCLYYRTWLPLVFVLGPNIYGAWMMPVYGWTQHAGLAEDVLDHRLNCRTVKMHWIHRFLYWNMNYHLEHHMFPLVPYHQLPKLHEAVKHDCPEPYSGLLSAYREIIPAVLRQREDPSFYVQRTLPEGANPAVTCPEDLNPEGAACGIASSEARDSEGVLSGGEVIGGWVQVCAENLLEREDVVRFDHNYRTYAVYKANDDSLYATDGICTHGNTHLADGLVKGKIVECPKHNGRFDLESGEAVRTPACVALKTYELEVREGQIFMKIETDSTDEKDLHHFRVVSNENVSTFIKELVLEPISTVENEESSELQYAAGQYMQFTIPRYERIKYKDFKIDPAYDSLWREGGLRECWASNEVESRRNYSIATSPKLGSRILKFNIRIAVPPQGQDCSGGAGSSYMFSLKAGDEVTAVGAHGDFLVKETEVEMVYLGGGAGMAPLRSHIAYLLEVLGTRRKISFWYGARSKQEIFYEDYFRELAERFENFSFHIVLSEPLAEDEWQGFTGFVHHAFKEHYLSQHSKPSELEYYLCGPPMMVDVTSAMLKDEYHVPETQIAYDAF